MKPEPMTCSPAPREYRNAVHQQLAASELRRRGVPVRAGQRIGYLIADGADDRRRVIPAEFVDQGTRYDPERYLKLLLYSASTILIPFGYSEDRLGRALATTGICTLDNWQ